MQIEQEAYAALSRKAVNVLGRKALLDLLPEQGNLFDKKLDRLLEDHGGDVKKCTSAQIRGAFDMIEHILPRELVLHFRK